QQGLVDRADKLLTRAARFATMQAPQLAWARLAITLGHGRAATAPPGLRPINADTRVLAARAAFAVGGAGALATTLDGFGADVVANDADLRLLKSLVAPVTQTLPPATIGPPRAKPSAAQEYVDGLRARLTGDSMLAAEHLSHALTGHADACRAAGEYVAALRALKRQPDAASFNTLRADNSGCVDLPPAR
ncbi:MAG TPA: hypothetical protein VK989_09715, partial [Polyangia bacterium]|nr:hypothetical protein [Polyangia bacterium]